MLTDERKNLNKKIVQYFFNVITPVAPVKELTQQQQQPDKKYILFLIVIKNFCKAKKQMSSAGVCKKNLQFCKLKKPLKGDF